MVTHILSRTVHRSPGHTRTRPVQRIFLANNFGYTLECSGFRSNFSRNLYSIRPPVSICESSERKQNKYNIHVDTNHSKLLKGTFCMNSNNEMNTRLVNFMTLPALCGIVACFCSSDVRTTIMRKNNGP